MKIGQMVILVQNNPPLKLWETGRVIEIMKDLPKLKQTIKLQTKHGVQWKHLHQLCLIPAKQTFPGRKQKVVQNAEVVHIEPEHNNKGGQANSSAKEKPIIMRFKKQKQLDPDRRVSIKSKRISRKSAWKLNT